MKWQSGFITGVLLIVLAMAVPDTASAHRPGQIIHRIESLVGPTLKRWCRSSRIEYPPEAVVFRVFKQEGRFEIWGKSKGMKHMRKIHTLRVCAMDRIPGPKTARGDGKTPEGVYRAHLYYGSRYDWMWIDLGAGRVERPGRVGTGHAFKICIDYPNGTDRSRSASLGTPPGGGICLHGNCVTAGCVSFTNRDYLAVFAFAYHHRTAIFGPVQIQIYPFDFERVGDLKTVATRVARGYGLDARRLVEFWRELKRADARFKAQPNPCRHP